IPLFFLSAALCFVTLRIQRLAEGQDLSLLKRVSNSAVAYVVYLGQTIYPTHLAVLYPYPKGNAAVVEAALALLFLIACSLVVWLWRKRYPFLLVGWLWFLGVLIPMIGIVQVGSQSHADRYMYLPGIGLAILAVYGAIALMR